MIAKCANPLCPARFDHRQGGKFFRFLREQEPTEAANGLVAAPNGSHNVQHFWLCARCCQILTLVYVEGRGVVIKPLEGDQATAAYPEQLTAA